VNHRRLPAWRHTRSGLPLATLLSLAPQAGSGQEIFQLDTIAPGVIVAQVVRDPAAYAFANSLIVIGDDGVLVVDTQQSTTAARALIAEIARITAAPVRWVVNTHWHADHVNGNQAYAAAFPDVEFIAHESLTEDMAILGTAARAKELAELPTSIEARQTWLSTGTGPDGAALSDSARAVVARSLRLRQAYLEEVRGIVPVPPTRTFDERLELHVGRHRVVLLHAGPAHTRGDILVMLPDLRIIAVGDLIEHGLPWFADSWPRGWQEALRVIAQLDPGMIVPSHAPPHADRNLLDDHLALFEAILHGVSQSAPLEGSGLASAEHGWPELERRFTTRYGVSASAFRAAIDSARARARALDEAASK
jgi:cyclase